MFGIWRTAEGRHRRIDIVVNSLPEEIAFCRMGWTGSRLFNRLLRDYAKKRHLYLSAHALLVLDHDYPLILRDHETGAMVRLPASRNSSLPVAHRFAAVSPGWPPPPRVIGVTSPAPSVCEATRPKMLMT